MGLKNEEFKELLEEYTLHIEEKDVLNFWKIRLILKN